MLHWTDLVVVDSVQLSYLFGSASFHVIDLILYQGVELLFFCIPSDRVFSQLSPQLFFIVFQKLYFDVGFLYFIFFYLKVLFELLDDSFILFNLLLEILNHWFLLALFEFGQLFKVINILGLKIYLLNFLFFALFQDRQLNWWLWFWETEFQKLGFAYCYQTTFWYEKVNQFLFTKDH